MFAKVTAQTVDSQNWTQTQTKKAKQNKKSTSTKTVQKKQTKKRDTDTKLCHIWENHSYHLHCRDHCRRHYCPRRLEWYQYSPPVFFLVSI